MVASSLRQLTPFGRQSDSIWLLVRFDFVAGYLYSIFWVINKRFADVVHPTLLRLHGNFWNVLSDRAFALCATHDHARHQFELAGNMPAFYACVPRYVKYRTGRFETP